MTEPIYPIAARWMVKTYGMVSQRAVAELKELPGVSWSGYRREISCGTDILWGVRLICERNKVNVVSVSPPLPAKAWGEGEVENTIRKSVFLPDWLLDGAGKPAHPKLSRYNGLHDYQKRLVSDGLERGGALIKAPAGSGKTLMSIVWSLLVGNGATLVITKSTVVTQFSRAIDLFTCDTVKAFPIHAPSKGRKIKHKDQPRRWTGTKWVVEEEALGMVAIVDDVEAWRGGSGTFGDETKRPVYVVGWDSLAIHLDDLLSMISPDCTAVVFDESQFAMAHRRHQWDGMTFVDWKDNRSAAGIRIASSIPRRLLLTATPIPDRRINLYGQLTLLAPGAIGARGMTPGGWGFTYTKFASRYCDSKPGQFGGLDVRGTSNSEELDHRLSFVRRIVSQTESHKNLPDYSIEIQYLSPSEQDRPGPGFKAELSRAAKAFARREGSASRQELDELMLQEAASRKRSAVLEWVESAVIEDTETGERGMGHGKVLIFTGRHRDCWGLAEKIKRNAIVKRVDATVWSGIEGAWKEEPAEPNKKRGLPDSYKLVSGSRRQDLQDLYMGHPGPCVLVATGYAWGTGLDLQDTDLFVIVMLPYEPGHLEQWLGRVYRLGMDRPCRAVIIVCEKTADVPRAMIVAEKVPDIERLSVEVEGLGAVRDGIIGVADWEATVDAIAKKLESGLLVDSELEDWEDE